MKGKNLLVLLGTAMCLVGCKPKQPEEPAKYERRDDSEVYDAVMGEYDALAAAAKAEQDDDLRYVKYAEAEAYLLGQAVFMPYSTRGGNFAITRVAPRTVPYAKWGNDDDRLKGLVAVTGEKNFITSAERAELIELWETARGGGAAYDPAAYLTGKGYSLATDYKTTFQTAPATLDVLNTSEQSDTEVLVNMIDGLYEYDNLGFLQPNMATGYDVSADGLTWTFHIRTDAKWFNAEGQEVAAVTAQDFVDGIHHMLDTQAGLEFLLEGVVVNAEEYIYGDIVDFSKVGVKAQGNDLVFTLCQPESYFITRLTYSCFMPMNAEFFLSKGGAFGIAEFKEASTKDTYSYGKYNDVSSMVYNGAYLPDGQFSDQLIALKKNANYIGAANVRLNTIQWVKDAGENPQQTWNAVLAGTYAGSGLSSASGTLEWAKAETDSRGQNLFNNCHYLTDTETVTYLLGMNVNRGTFVLANGACASAKTEAQKIATNAAMNNVHFRRAIFRAWDRVSYDAVSVGAEAAGKSLRNSYTDPNFLFIGKNVEYKGHTFAAGMTYGDLIQYFGDQAGLGVNFADGQDGWYNPTKAVEEINLAKQELGDVMNEKIVLENVYYANSTSQVQNATAFKQLIERVLGDHVIVNLIEATTTDDFYACGYRAKNGAALAQDVFYGSGWGPDYGDPSTYLDTFAKGGYMTKICGF
jgi:ABC-type oligopeptide transport system substrate-binding subunit